MKTIHRILSCFILLSFILFPFSSVADSKEKLDIHVGDKIALGQYIQDAVEQKPEPITWIVLEKNKNRLTMISEKVLEVMPFHDKDTGTLWSQCSLRKWLNKEFYNTAFSKKEQRAIVSAKHTSFLYDDELHAKSQSTNDKVFILNAKEVVRYFYGGGSHSIFGLDSLLNSLGYEYNDVTKDYYHAEITTYADYGHSQISFVPIGEKITNDWWLRDSYFDRTAGSYTGSSDPRFYIDYDKVTRNHGVRPVIVVDSSKIDKDMVIKKDEKTEDQLPVSLSADADYTVMLGFNINFKSNRLFSKYDVSLYVDGDHICDLEHGKNKAATCRVKKGKHRVSFFKKDDHSISVQAEVTINEHSYMDCSISTKRDAVELQDAKTVPRYKISNPTTLAAIKEYDAIVDKLAIEYDRGYHQHKREGRSYEDYYYLLGSKSEKALCFIVPKNVSNSNPVTLATGRYITNPSSGLITVIPQNGPTYSIKPSRSLCISDRYKSFYAACDELILYMYPEIHGRFLSARIDLIENDREHYKRIVMDD